MPRRARIVIPGIPHHVTARGSNRQDTFFTDADRAFYLDVLADYAARFELRVDGYCLMTNHVHVICIPGNTRSLALAIGRTQQRYAQYINRLHGRTGHLWADRFFSCPLEPVHRYRAMAYVERNPIRAGMVAAAWDYPWSSASTHCACATAHPVLRRPDGERHVPNPEAWRTELGRPEPEHELDRIRHHTMRGIPLGSDTFIARLESALGRRLRPNPVGRPKRRVDADGLQRPNVASTSASPLP